MADAHKNFAISTVATAPSPAASGTSLVVAAGHGTRFPAVPFNATICPSGTTPDPTNAEIVRVTNISTDTFTITRAQESTSARTVVVGDLIFASVTAKTLEDVETLLDDHSARHENGGADEINVAGLSGELADPQPPKNHDHSANKLAQANTHESPDTDTATTALHHTLGTGANQAAAGDHTHTPSQVGLGNVTNNAQTQAAIVPNTAPSAGQILVGNAGGTAYAPVSMSGDATLASTGALTIASTTGTGAFVRTSSPTLSGTVTLSEDAAIMLDAALSATGKYCGIIESGTAGAALAFGNLVYFAAADSRWELADADAESTAGAVKIGICVLAAAADGDPTTILLYGKVRADSLFPTFTVGAPVYAGTTAGEVQTTKPSGTDDVIRIVGYGNTGDELFFCPSPDYMTSV